MTEKAMTIQQRIENLIEQARIIAFSASSPNTKLRINEELAEKDAEEFKEYFESELTALLEQVAKEQREIVARKLPDRCFVDMDESWITSMTSPLTEDRMSNKRTEEGEKRKPDLKNFLWKKPNPKDNPVEIFIETYDGYPVAGVDLCDSEWAEKLVAAYNATYGSGIDPEEINPLPETYRKEK